MWDVDSLVTAIEGDLEPLRRESGKVLYSAADTLRRGDLYLVGLNPGGDPAHPESRTIVESLRDLRGKTTNDYLDEAWTNRRGAYTPGHHPLQQRVRKLLEDLDYDPRSVCASNLIFTRSASAGGAGYPARAHQCWPVHERILAVVEPKAIIAFGNSGLSPFQYLLDLARATEGPAVEVETIDALHGSWKCRAFVARLAGRPVAVLGLPHLSWYSPAKPAILEWLRARIHR